MILARQRENKAAILGAIKDLGLAKRTINDPGELGDAIIFLFDDRAQADRFVAGLKSEGLGTKNVPDAMGWHFAKHWGHIFKKYGWYENTYQTQWQKSADILERAVALPVMINPARRALDRAVLS